MPEMLTANALGFPSPRVLSLAINQWSAESTNFIGGSILPAINHDAPTIEWDELAGISGMTQVSAMDADALAVAKQILRTYKEDPFVFKEIDWLEESDLLRVRMRGMFNRLAGEQLAMDQARRLSLRLDVRDEWLTWKAIQGSLAIDENNVKRTITYGVQTPSAPSTKWDTVASATPIDNIQAWLGLFDGVGGGNVRCYYGRAVANALSQNAQVRDLAKQSGFAANIGISPGQVHSLISKFVGNVDSMQMYKEGFLNSAGSFEPFIGAKNFVMICDPPQGQPLGNLVSTLSVRNGGVNNPRPGRWAVVHDKVSEAGRYGLEAGKNQVPVIYFPKCIIVVQVLT